MNENTKQHRQNTLKKLIKKGIYSDQQRLQEVLKEEGISATQATISRDFQDLGVIKVRVKPGLFKYRLLEKLPPDLIVKKLKVLFENFVVELKGTQNLLLVKTSPGNANGVASYIDRLQREEIMGTVAGDDTILVVINDEPNRIRIQGELEMMINAREQDA